MKRYSVLIVRGNDVTQEYSLKGDNARDIMQIVRCITFMFKLELLRNQNVTKHETAMV